MRPLTSTALVLGLLVACGDGSDAPAAAPSQAPAAQPAAAPAVPPPAAADPIPPGPPEATLDDEVVLAAVVAAATGGTPLPGALAKLPPRVSPVRVAVRAVDDHVAGAPGAASDWGRLLDALAQLAEPGRTAVDGGALGALVAAWRAWTPEQREAEAAFAEYYTRRLELLRSPLGIDVKALAAEPQLPAAPPKSPAAASAVAVRVAMAAVVTPGESSSPELRDAMAAAVAAFDGLGWPGGLGPILEVAVARLERDGKRTLRSAYLAEAAGAAFRASGDTVSAALLDAEAVRAAERAGDVKRAEAVARDVVKALTAAGARGQETARALFRHAQLALAVGKPADAAAALDRALAEIEFAGLDPAQRIPVGERRATALWFLGRYDEAVAAADDGARAFDAKFKSPPPEMLNLRAAIDAIAARALVDGGRPADGAQRFLAAAERHAKARGDERAGGADRLFAADAFVKAGAADAARRIVDPLVASPTLPVSERAQASEVLRDLGDFDASERELARVEAGVAEDVRPALLEVRARLAAARKDFDAARAAFAAAARRATGGSDGVAAGFAAGRIHADWAKAERDAGDLEEAARLADLAMYHFSGSGYVAEQDRALELWVDMQRRRGLYRAAEQASVRRAAEAPPARREDAAFDVFVTRLEASLFEPDLWRPKVDEAIAALPEAARDTAARLVAGAPGAGAPTPAPTGRAARLALAASVLDAPQEVFRVARELGAEEPELRRWVLAVTASGGEPSIGRDTAKWLSLRREDGEVSSPDVIRALPEGTTYVAIDCVGGATWLSRLGADASRSLTRHEGDAGLGALWDAVRGDPKSLDAAARGVLAPPARQSVAPRDPFPGPRVVVSVGAPFGMLPIEMTPAFEAPDRAVVEEVSVSFVTGPAEIVACAKRPAPEKLSFLRSPDAPLRERHALVVIAPVDPASQARFVALVDEGRARGLDAAASVHQAKLRLRTEWKQDPARPVVPPWAAIVMRGLP